MKSAAPLFLLLLISATSIAGGGREVQLSSADKSQIIRSILLRTNFHVTDGETQKIHLSTENVPHQVLQNLPNITRVEFVLVSPAEVAERSKSGFEYFRFSDFEVKGSSVLISFIENRVTGTGYQSYSGLRYEYRKVRGKWRGKIVGYPLGMS